MEILAFSVGGRLVARRFDGPAYASGERDKSEAADGAEICHALNREADEISARVEDQIQRYLPADAGVRSQVQLSFRPGSILLEGTVLLVGWVGSTILAAMKEQLAELIKSAIRRTLNSFLPDGVPFPGDVSVSELQVRPVTSGPAAVEGKASEAPVPRIGSRLDSLWLYAFVGLLTLLVLMLLGDRLFNSWQPSLRPVPSPSATAPVPAAPSPAR
jgi:hypothetical protein